MKKTRVFIDTETNKIIQESELFNDFLTELSLGVYESENDYKHYINSCLTSNNGTLEEVEEITAENANHHFNMSYLPAQLKNILASTKLYVTNSKEYYTADGRYFSDKDALFEINENEYYINFFSSKSGRYEVIYICCTIETAKEIGEKLYTNFCDVIINDKAKADAEDYDPSIAIFDGKKWNE